MNMTIFTLVVSVFYLQIITVIADDVFPDYYMVNFTNSNDNKLKGFYKKENYEHNGKPVYKKPRIRDFLYFTEDNKWTIGVKWTMDKDENDARLTMETDHDYDIPRNGAWSVSSGLDVNKIDVSITEYSQKYPEYYEVNIPGHQIDGFYKKSPESENYENFPTFKKRAFGGKEEYFLYLHLRGDWRISFSTIPGQFYATSTPRGVPSPEFSKSWKVWQDHKWNPNTNLSVVPRNPVYPTSYTVRYQGQDQNINDTLQRLNALGDYRKQSSNHDNVPVYKKEGSEMNLFRVSTGNWVISYNVKNGERQLYQESNDSPTPVQNKPWKLTVTKDEIVVGGFSVTPIITDEERNPKMLKDVGELEAGDSTPIWIVAIIVGVLTTTTVVAISAFCLNKKFCRKEEQPKIDENWYYGDDYDDNDNDNAIVDDNDYYGSI
eukprot:GFUD01013341.1.p1 GENE.GFUD01013341.1~~GFUD01013341.1.p1  ORF type:complete len:433 (+),score=98.10 GFUD01013341.1:49-1347(+)